MCSISSRLNTLNNQLILLSKLQRMEEEPYIHPHSMCKIYRTQNNFGRVCHCAQGILSLKEQCSGVCYIEDRIQGDTCKKKLVCNARACRARKRLLVCKSTRLSEVQTDMKNDVRISKSASINTENNTISQSTPEMEVKQNMPDQINSSSPSFKSYVNSKIVETLQEKSEQIIPTKDNFYESNVNNSKTNSVQVETLYTDKIETEVEKNVSEEISQLGELHYSADNMSMRDRKIFERIQKELLNERKRNKELEKKLKSLTCSFNCLKEDNEQKAACLKGALKTAEEQTKIAMDLVNQTKDQTELVKGSRDELFNEISQLQQQTIEVAHRNTILTQERDQLKNKIGSLSEEEAKRCEEIEKEVNRMKCALKEKEDALNKERSEFMSTITELTNVIKIQKRRMCEVSSACNSQQYALQEKEKELSVKSTELSEVQNILKAKNCTCKEMEEQIDNLKYCLFEETKACNCLKQELETLKEAHSSEIRIKEKIAEEQNRTITKQRKLLHDSEEMAQHLAYEFDELKTELYEERQRNKSLQKTLDRVDNKLKNVCSGDCEKCISLKSEIDYLKEEKHKALALAKFTYQKLNKSMKDYQKELVCEKQQHRYMTAIIEKKEMEIGYLKSQIYRNHTRTVKKMNGYVLCSVNDTN